MSAPSTKAKPHSFAALVEAIARAEAKTDRRLVKIRRRKHTPPRERGDKGAMAETKR